MLRILIEIESIPEVDTIAEIPKEITDAVRDALQQWRKHVAVEMDGPDEQSGNVMFAKITALGIEARPEKL